MGITLVTTTHKRPYCFSLLEQWIKRQSVKPDQWLVVSDNWEKYRFTMGQEVIKRNADNDTLHSMLENWLAAIPKIQNDKIIVSEDDDWYHPEYIETMSGLLDQTRLAGFSFDLYYKLPLKKYKRCGNPSHASLAATGFTREMIPFIERCKLHKSVYIDCYLWAEGTADCSNWRLIPNTAKDKRAYHVGMKCMPGGKGLGQGHTEEGAADFNDDMLRSWIGAADCRTYQSIPSAAWNNPLWMPTEASVRSCPAIEKGWMYP